MNSHDWLQYTCQCVIQDIFWVFQWNFSFSRLCKLDIFWWMIAFHCSYMALSSSTYLAGFFQQIYTNLAYYEKTDIKIVWSKFELKWSLVGQLSKLFMTLTFSIKFRSQIEDKVSDYRLLWATRLYFMLKIGLLFHSRFSNSVLSLM